MSLRIGLGMGILPLSVTSVPTTVPVNVSPPTISGIATQGQTLTCIPGTWAGLPSGSYAYQWLRAGANISGATNFQYTLVSADVGQAITVQVIATNSVGPSLPAVSSSVTPVAILTISGTPPGGRVGTAYTYTPTSTGGRATKTYALTGTLPSGLSFSTSTGGISGTSLASGTASGLNITVTDGDGLTATLGTFSIVVAVVSAITGAPIAAVVRDSTPLDVAISGNGYILDITFKGLATGGTADPSKVSIAVTRPGFDNAGVSTTYPVTVTGTLPARHAGGSTTPIQTTSGSDVVISYVLDRAIFAGEAIVVTLAAGAYTGSNASTPALFGVTNNSTFAHLIPMVAMITPPHLLVTGGSMSVEIAAFHAFAQKGSEVACMKMRAKDVAGNTGAWTTVTAMTLSTTLTYSGLAVQCYRGLVDTSTINAGDAYIEYVAYPWWGSRVYDSNNALGGGQDGTTLLDSAGDSTSNLTVNTCQNPPCKLHFYNDKAGTYGSATAIVDPSNGSASDAWGVGGVFANQTLADAGAKPWATIAAAAAAIKLFNNANNGHNDTGNGQILLQNGTYNGAGASMLTTPVTGSVWLYVKKHPTATAASVNLVSVHSGTLTSRHYGRRTWLEDVSLNGNDGTTSGASQYLVGNDGFAGTIITETALNRVKVSDGATKVGTTNWHSLMGLVWVYNCDITDAAIENNGGRGGQLIGGNKFLRTNGSCHWQMGNRFENSTFNDRVTVGTVNIMTRYQPDIQNWIGAFNYDYRIASVSNSLANSIGEGTAGSGLTTAHGYVWAYNLTEVCHPTSLEKAIQLDADAVHNPIANVVIRCNTAAGGRSNYLYEDIGTATTPKTGVYQANLEEAFNNKGDQNGTPDAHRVGNFAFRFGVDAFPPNFAYQGTNNSLAPAPVSWYGDRFAGPNQSSGVVDPKFVNKASSTATGGTGLGNGDYHRHVAGLQAAEVIPPSWQPSAFYLDGTARDNTTNGPAGAFGLVP